MGYKKVNSSYTNKDGRVIGFGPKGALYLFYMVLQRWRCLSSLLDARKTYMFTLDSKRIDVKSHN